MGTYRSDIYADRSIRKYLLGMTPVGTNFGGCLFTDGIFVFDRERYRSIFPSVNNVIGIDIKLVDYLKENIENLIRIFPNMPCIVTKKKEAVIYLSSWVISEDVVRHIGGMAGSYRIVKLHPHIRDDKNFKGVDLVVSGTVPSEIMFSRLMSVFDRIIVYHHGSSAKLYMNDPNVLWVAV